MLLSPFVATERSLFVHKSPTIDRNIRFDVVEHWKSSVRLVHGNCQDVAIVDPSTDMGAQTNVQVGIFAVSRANEGNAECTSGIDGKNIEHMLQVYGDR